MLPNFFRDQIIPVYKLSCQKYGKIKMLDFIGSTKEYNIQNLFLDIVVKNCDRYKSGTPITYNDITKLASEDNVVLLESISGGGSTTLIQFIMNDWSKGGSVMNVAGYDLVVPVFFQNSNFSTVGDLISDLIFQSPFSTVGDPNSDPMPGIKMTNEEVLAHISDPSLNILFLCDGYANENINSAKLYKEIVSLKKQFSHMKLITTSRPESIKEFYYSIGRELVIDHLKILGICESKRSEFLMKVYNDLLMDGMSKQSTNELLEYYNSSSARFNNLFRLPTNLVMLAWIWIQDPEKVNTIKSQTGLISSFMNINERKLVMRLEKYGGNLVELEEMINDYKRRVVFPEALRCLKHNRIFIDGPGVIRLRSVSRDLGLPYAEILSTYFLTGLHWTNSNTLEDTVQFKNKSIQDYYGAKEIESNIIKGCKNIKGVMLDLYENDVKRYHEELHKYQNVFTILAGNLGIRDPSLVDQFGLEIIQLLIETGIRDNTQWFSIYYDMCINLEAAEKFGWLIAPHINIENFTINDAYVEELGILSTLLRYVDVEKVVLSIRSSTMLEHLPSLLETLINKQCSVSIENIEESQIGLWIDIINTYKHINIEHVKLGIMRYGNNPQLRTLINILKSKNGKIRLTFSRLEIDNPNFLTLNNDPQFHNHKVILFTSTK